MRVLACLRTPPHPCIHPSICPCIQMSVPISCTRRSLKREVEVLERRIASLRQGGGGGGGGQGPEAGGAAEGGEMSLGEQSASR